MHLFPILITAPLIAATIHTDFEGGSLGRIEKISNAEFRLGAKGEKDQDGRNRQASWYYFRVDGAAKKPMVLDIVDLPGEYNYQPNRGAITKDTPPFISYDQRTWKHVQTFAYDSAVPKLRLRLTPEAAQFWIAHVPPYTNETLARLRTESSRHADFHEQIIGKTVSGRDLALWTINSGAASGAKRSVWLMFRQHSWESGSSWAAEGAVRALLRNDAESRRLRQSIVWKIFPLCDPDGVARGGVRFNANGYDLNRNWDIDDPVKMPEIAAQRNAVREWVKSGHSVDLYLSLHNTETSEYVEGPPDKGGRGRFQSLADRLFQTLTKETTFAATRPLSYAETTTTAGKPGRMNVAQGLYQELGIAAFIMEQRISYNGKLGHLPEIHDRVAFGAQLVRAIGAAVAPPD